MDCALLGVEGSRFGYDLQSVERMDIGRHPDVDPRAYRAQPPVVILQFGDQRLRLGDRHETG